MRMSDYLIEMRDSVYATWKSKVGRRIGIGIAAVCLCGILATGCSTKAERQEEHAILWKFQSGGRITSSPVIDHGSVYFGSDDQRIYAVEEGNGHSVWTFQADAAVRSTPRIAGSTLYATSNAGTLYSLDLRTGKARWAFHTDVKQGTLDEWDYYDSSPAVDGGSIYFGSADGSLYAVDASNGRKLWSFKASGPVKSSPVFDDRGVYFGDWSGKLYGLDKQTGKPEWSYQTPANGRHVAIQSTPALRDGVLYWGCRNFSLYAMDSRTGTIKWTLNEPAWAASPVFEDGNLYVGNSNGYFLQAVKASDGKEEWRFSTVSNVLAAPAIADGTAYFGTEYAYQEKTERQEYLYAVDLKTGKEKWKLPTHKIQSTPAVDGHTLVYTSFDGYLYAVSLKE